jgi:hypothetical protein
MRYHRDGTQPQPDEVFVFGSNLAGVHGAGAAKQAVEYGAKYGMGVGMTGRAYAIPTKNEDINTMPVVEIASYIDGFVKFTNAHPGVKFFVTRVGCGLAGHKDDDIAPLFKGCSDNCNLPDQWKTYFMPAGCTTKDI